MFEYKFDDKILDNIEEEKKFPYFPLPLVIKRAENSCLYDIKEKKYIDLTSNRENNPLGYSNIFAENENHFLDTQLFNSNNKIKLTETLKSLTGLEKVYFSSDLDEIYQLTSELLGVYLNKTNRSKILLSVNPSNKDSYQIKDATAELIPLNKDSLLKTLLSREVGAVVIQLTHISNEITFADDEYLTEVRKLCDKNNALLVFDCTDFSPLRLNKGLFNYNKEIKPDIIIVSKGFAQGLPLSCLVLSDKISDIIVNESELGVYSPAYTAASKFIEDFQNGKSAELIDSNTDYITKKLAELLETHISFVDFYSSGMLFTMVVDVSAYKFAKQAFNKGVLLDTLNDSKIILSPPYNIQQEEINYFISVFDTIFDSLGSFDRLK